MIRFIVSLFVVSILLFLSFRNDSYGQNRRTTRTKQLIVTFKEKPKATDLINISKYRRKSRLKFAITNSRSIVYEPATSDTVAALEELKADPAVESVVYDRKLDLLYMPNDLAIRATPIPGKPRLQWDMFNLNLAGQGRTAWDISKGSPEVIVAVLDSGVDSSHEDLAEKFVSLVDCTGGPCRPVQSMSANPDSLDESHGTHVAGIIGASSDNNTGVVGSGFNTSLMALKIRDSNGEMLISYFVNAIRYAADQGVHIINMSLGSLEGNLDGPIISAINDAINYAWSKNVLLVAAAGNCGWDASHHRSNGDPCDIYDINGNFVRHAINEKFYPAASPNVISVAALDVNNQLAAYSEHNAPGEGNWISVAAPGGMFVTEADKEFGIANTWPGSSYYFNLGTSAASPHVSGIAALILARNPTLTNAQLKAVIEQTANRNIIPGKTNFGMVNAVAALDSLNVPSPVTTGTISPTRIPTTTPVRTPTRTPTQSPFISPTRTPTITSFVSPTRTPTGAVNTPTRTSIKSPTPTPKPPTATFPVEVTPDECKNNPLSASCFFAWYLEYTKSIRSIFTDFNNDDRVDLIDFEIWRRSNL